MEYGNKLDAIKFVREAGRLGLSEAKTWVENYKTYDLRNPHQITDLFASASPTIEDQIKQGASELGKQITGVIKDFLPKNAGSSVSVTADPKVIKELKKKRNNNIALGILFIYLFWPVSIYFFVKAHKRNKELKQLKG